MTTQARLGGPVGEGLFSIEIAPIGTGDTGGLLLVFEDLSERETASRLRRDFVADVSHELKTPLTAIRGFLDTLNGAARNDETMRTRFLALMGDEVDRMGRLVEGLLALSRLEGRIGPPPSDLVDLTEIARETSEFFAQTAAAQGVTVISGEMPDAAIVAGDPDQLRQVARNLVTNALVHADADRVAISVVAIARDAILRAPAICLRVEDDGRGIAERHIPRLTERFYRAEHSRARSGPGGTGLGLSIVKHILLRHSGRLAVTSEPGQGSRFDAILPCVPDGYDVD